MTTRKASLDLKKLSMHINGLMLASIACYIIFRGNKAHTVPDGVVCHFFFVLTTFSVDL